MKIRVCDFCMKPLKGLSAIHTIKHKFYEEGYPCDTFYRQKLEICDPCWNEMSHYIVSRLSSKQTSSQ